MMKRMSVVVAVLMVFTLTACGIPVPIETPLEIPSEITTPTSNEQNNTPVSESRSSETPADGAISADDSNTLIAYFSSAGNIVTDEEASGNVGHGNTKTVADLIQGQTGGNVFFIETVAKYPANYNDTIDVAMQEQRADARPALASHVENMDDYDVIFLGYPNWWGTMPQAVFTFLDEYDFSGKIVIPFCTHEGSGFGRSVADLTAYIPEALFLDGFSVRGSDAGNAQEDVKQWISELQLNALNRSVTTPPSTAPSDTSPSASEPPAPEPSSSETQAPSGAPTSAIEPQANVGTKILVVYFSMPETTNASNMTQDEENSVVVIDGQVLGNTQYVAQIIQKNTGGDIFRIEPKTPYPTDHATLVDLADKEQKENARPELLTSVENLDPYDIVFLGYPNWWADMPMILYTFLEGHDLSGKTIIPFNTHGGSGFSNTIRTIAQLQPNAIVAQNGFTVSRNNVADSENDVIAWVASLNLAG